jgi:hypothetical protein
MRRLSITIVLLLIISCSSLFVYNAAATTLTFGNTNVGTITNTFSGTKDASRFQLTENGTIQSITVYFANYNYDAKAAIYTDSSGAPSQLIAQSTSQRVSSIGWLSFVIPQTSLSSGYYWLSTSTSVFAAAGVMSAIGSSGSHCWVSSTFASDFSSSFGTPRNSDSNAPSIYATYTPTPSSTPKVMIYVPFNSYGVITYTTPTPSSVNLAPLPTAWETANTGMWLAIGGAPSVVLDTTVKYNGESTLRLDGNDASNGAREADGPYTSIKPGDHIIFSCWMKTSTSSTGDANPLHGARLGIDFYGAKGAITGTSSPDGTPVYTQAGGWCETQTNVIWGTSTWTLITIDFIVQSSYEYSSNAIINPNYNNGQLAAPTAIIPWMQVMASNDGGQGWFSNPQLYINS